MPGTKQTRLRTKQNPPEGQMQIPGLRPRNLQKKTPPPRKPCAQDVHTAYATQELGTSTETPGSCIVTPNHVLAASMVTGLCVITIN